MTQAELRALALGLPSQWSRHGWTQLKLVAIPDAEMADLVRHAWRQVAPKALTERPA